jgi:hypothetical protein
MKRIALAGALAALVGILPAAAGAQVGPTCPSVAPPPLSFSSPTFIDKNRAGGEPVSIVAPDGSISVSTHAGTTHIYKDPQAAGGASDFGAGYTNQTLNWRSTDGGGTWKFVGIGGTEVGPHSATSTGFSDPDFTMDQGGRIYNTEIDLANVAVFSSDDYGQSYSLATPEAASGDRPWLTGQEKDEVFLYVNLPKQLYRSTDAGVTWKLIGGEAPANTAAGTAALPITGKMLVDPLNPDHGLIGPVGVTGIAISANDGTSWTSYPGAKLGISKQFFGVPAVDTAGTVYVAAAGGYESAGDTNPTGRVTFNYFDRTANAWGRSVNIPIPKGDALWPWLIAGDDGRAAVVWYQNLAGSPNEFYIYAAYTTNAHGTTVTCSDGSTRFIDPQFSVTNASGRPVHLGRICLDGTNCNASTSFEGGDRRLGDFFTVNYDLDGRLFIASGDTTLKSRTNGPKPVGNPIFMKQTSGDSMLTVPIPAKPTPCVFPHLTCGAAAMRRGLVRH